MSRFVVSPDTIIRFKQGKLWIHAADPAKSLTAERPDIIQLLVSFAAPAEPGRVSAAYPTELRLRVEQTIRGLIDLGLLVQADRAATAGNEVSSAIERLATLATTVNEVTADLFGFGPDGERLLSSRGDRDVGSRVCAALAAMDSLAADLAAARQQYLDEQLARLGVAPADRHLKINLGAGERKLAGWINIDIYPAELAMNVKWGLPFADGAADHVYSAHFLEHLYYPREALALLQDIRRVLAPGGRLRLVVPDIEKSLHAYSSGDRTFFTRRKETWDWWPQDMTPLEDVLLYAGAGPDPGRLFEAHKFGYDFETLSRLLGQAGFADIMRSDYMASSYEVLRVDDASLVAGAHYSEDAYYSLFVEATRH